MPLDSSVVFDAVNQSVLLQRRSSFQGAIVLQSENRQFSSLEIPSGADG